MKPSGIEWIGDIPDDWEVRKVKRLFSYQKGKNAALLTKEYISLHPGEYPVLSGQTENDGILGYYESYEFDLDKDSIFVTTVGAKAMSTRLVNAKFSLSQNCALLHKIDEKSDVRFLHYALFPMFEWQKSMISLIMQPSLRFEDLDKATLPYPPTKTQQKIADYLDEKCGEIDATIAKQKESIEKLKAYKQSLISETVTKGLDKSAPLKPSGIEWIGDIPAHWEVCKIKNHCNLKTGSTPSSKDLSMFDGAENWFTPSDFTENYMLKNSLRRLNAKVFDQNLVPIFPPLSVLIVGIGATTGKVGFTTSKSSSNQQITAIIPKDKNIFPKFLLFWMIANTKMIRETALFTTLPILNNDTLGNATLLIPPYKEQLELASYIENKNIEIDVIINKKQNIIQKLDAYKKSLIFECVTGKTDL